MARFLGGLALAGALVLSTTACGDGPEPKTGSFNVTRAAAAVHVHAERLFGTQATVGPVRCPSGVPIQKDLVFVCTVTLDGAPLVYRVRQQDGQGDGQIELAQAAIATTKVEDFVVSAGLEKRRPVDEASCGRATLLIKNPGTKLTCTVDFEDGSSGSASVGVLDAAGKVALISFQPPTR